MSTVSEVGRNTMRLAGPGQTVVPRYVEAKDGADAAASVGAWFRAHWLVPRPSPGPAR